LLGESSWWATIAGRFEPWLKQGNLLNQPAYNFYVRVKAEEPMEPVSGETVVLPAEQASEKQAVTVMKHRERTTQLNGSRAGWKD